MFFSGLEAVALPDVPVHLAIGMFDGVHLGHRSVIESAVQSARRSGGLAGVLTFWPHPSRVLRPGSPTLMMMDREVKRRVLAGLGIDFIVEVEFTAVFAATSASEFVASLRRQLPKVRALYVGANWRFGRGREGDVAVLIREASTRGIEVFSAERLNHNGAPISSSRIRELLAEGAVAEANALLGYSYFCEGEVQSGRRLGRTLGFPTLNLPWNPELAPRRGVYVVSVTGPDGKTTMGVANYGVRPTVEDQGQPLLEVHVLGETNLGPGSRLTVRWLESLRPEKRFGGVEELRAQIARDRQDALAWVSRAAVGQ